MRSLCAYLPRKSAVFFFCARHKEEVGCVFQHSITPMRTRYAGANSRASRAPGGLGWPGRQKHLPDGERRIAVVRRHAAER